MITLPPRPDRDDSGGICHDGSPTSRNCSEAYSETGVPVRRALSSNKHLLQHRWALWFDNPKLKKPHETWAQNLKKIYSFNTVEDFWSLYNNIQQPSKLSTSSNYHLFKDGVQPMWEDAENINGGKWVLSLQRQERKHIDEYWLHMLLAVVGETLDETGDICGCVISLRKNQDRLALWTASCMDPKTQLLIGKRLRLALGLPRNTLLQYQSHADAAQSGSSFHNSALYEA
mmetsp:Transcript_7174/g.10770  ORF Transcript_7174/g.10770 Transcript_7174/m.10770 type:complete len:230 (+) Transcript_7174:108-797(+)